MDPVATPPMHTPSGTHAESWVMVAQSCNPVIWKKDTNTERDRDRAREIDRHREKLHLCFMKLFYGLVQMIMNVNESITVTFSWE